MALTEADGSPAQRRIIEEPERPIRKCAYCGTPGPHRDHSGVPECGDCWNWRKLDSAAARYWYILSLMVGSSTDAYDVTQFFPKQLGWTSEDTKTFNRLIRTMFEKTEAMAKSHHVDERWKEQAQALFDQLANGIRPKPKDAK